MNQSFKIAAILVLAALPLLEIGLLIRIGQTIGLWWLALIIIGTAVLGTFVIRRVGLSVFERALSSFNAERQVFPPLFDGFLQVLAGLLLIFPGVISDGLGLALLVPQIRRLVVHTGILKLITLFQYQADVSRDAFRGSEPEEPEAKDGIVIEGEYERLSEKPLRPARTVQVRRPRP